MTQKQVGMEKTTEMICECDKMSDLIKTSKY